MTIWYTVKPGDCLTSIAAAHGTTWKELYDHADNETLRKLRPDPHFLLPGDLVAVPDNPGETYTFATGARHTIRIKRHTARLRLTLVEGLEGKRFEAAYELTAPGLQQPIKGTARAGQIDIEIPATATSATLTLFEDDGETVLERREVRIGYLDPLETPTGIQQRLRRLGFDCGPVDGKVGPRTRAALQAFWDSFGVDDDARDDKNTPFGAATIDRFRDLLSAE